MQKKRHKFLLYLLANRFNYQTQDKRTINFDFEIKTSALVYASWSLHSIVSRTFRRGCFFYDWCVQETKFDCFFNLYLQKNSRCIGVFFHLLININYCLCLYRHETEMKLHYEIVWWNCLYRDEIALCGRETKKEKST